METRLDKQNAEMHSVEKFIRDLRARLKAVQDDLAQIPAEIEKAKAALDGGAIRALKQQASELSEQLLLTAGQAQKELRERQRQYQGVIGPLIEESEADMTAKKAHWAGLVEKHREELANAQLAANLAESEWNALINNSKSGQVFFDLNKELTEVINNATSGI